MASDLPSEFLIERYFARYEFTAPYLLCCSDVEALDMCELVAMADPECQAMWSGLKLTYTDSAGHPLLRREAAKLHGVTEDETLVIAPQEGIYIAMKCIISYLKK